MSMFDEDPSIPILGQSEPEAERPPLPVVPPLRVFKVLRYDDDDDSTLVTQTILAHNFTVEGPVLKFNAITAEYDVNSGQPALFQWVRHAFFGWKRVEEVIELVEGFDARCVPDPLSFEGQPLQ